LRERSESSNSVLGRSPGFTINRDGIHSGATARDFHPLPYSSRNAGHPNDLKKNSVYKRAAKANTGDSGSQNRLVAAFMRLARKVSAKSIHRRDTENAEVEKCNDRCKTLNQ
jgi:hypothetical protein